MKRWIHPRTFGLLMTRVVLIALPLLFAKPLNAQTSGVQVNLIMSPNPSPYLSDWQQRRETATFQVINPTPNRLTFKIKTQIFLNGNLKAETKMPDMPVLSVNGPGTFVCNAENIIPVRAIKVYGEGEQAIVQSGKIPAGSYRICSRVVDAETEQPLSPDACANFTVTSYQLPQLLLPPNNSTLNAEQSSRINFTWTPVVPQTPTPPRYVLRVFEVLPGQQPMSAFLANRPVLEAETFGVPSLLWPPDILGPRPDQPYIWSVQTLDEAGRTLADPNGYAAPFTFTVKNPDHTTEVKCNPGSCLIKGVSVERVETTRSAGDAPGTPIGSGLQVKADVTANCPPGCPPVLEVKWSVLVINGDGTTHTAVATGQSTIITLPFTLAAGAKAIIQVEASVRCGNSAASTCSGTFEHELGGTDGGTTRPPTVTELDTIEFPPEIPTIDTIPTTTTTPLCSPLPPKNNKGPGISLGAMLDQPDLFPYPRAVPLRADAVDMDYAIFRCLDCEGGVASIWKPVRDRVESYQWKLEGKGSLNVPFDLDGMKKTDDSIAAVAKRLAEIADSLDQLKADTAAMRTRLEAQKKDAEKQIEQIKIRLDSVAAELKRATDSLTTTNDSLGTLKSLREAMVKARNDSITIATAAKKSIDSLDAILAGKPTAEERAKLTEINTARTAATAADSSVARKTRDIQTESARLKTAVDNAAAELAAATAAYESLKRGGEAETKKVADLNKKLYGPSVARAYFNAQRAWDLAASSFIGRHLPGSQTTLGGSLNKLNDAAESGLASSSTAVRTTALATFRTRMAALKTALTCSGIADADKKSACTGDLPALHAAAAAYDGALDAALKSAYKLSPALLADLSATRTKLTAKEGSINSASKTVERKSDDYEAALRSYTTTIKGLETDRSALLATAATKNERVATLESEYQLLVKARQTDLEQKRESYLVERHGHHSRRDAMLRAADALRDTIAQIDNDTARLNRLKEHLEQVKAELETEKKQLTELQKKFQEILDLKIEDAQKPLVAKIAALEKEQEKLKKQLEDLKKSKETLAEGNKTAEGALVYYIPPPLEEILKNEPKFTALKDSVAAAERGLVIAQEFKAGAQKKLTKELERIARQMTNYKKAEAEKKTAEEEANNLDRELSTLKNNKTQEYQDYQNRLLDILERNEAHKDTAEKRISEGLADSATLAQKIEQQRQRIEGLEKEIETLETNLNDARAQLSYEEGLRQNAKNTLAERTAELNNARRELQELEDDLSRAQQSASRAAARSNARREIASDAEVSSRKGAVAAKKTAITTLESGVASIASSYQSAQQRAATAEDTLVGRSESLVKKQQELRNAKDTLVELNEQMEELLTGLNYWRMVLAKAEGEIEKCNDARKQFQEKIADAVNDDDAVKSKDEEKKAAEEQAKEAEAAMKKAEEEIASALRRRDDITKAMKDTVQNARKKLQSAKDSLRQYLLDEEFKVVTHEVKLTIKAVDSPLDGFRAQDDTVTILTTLRYPGDRVPVFSDSYPSVKIAPKKQLAGCNPQVGFIPPGPIVPIPPALEMPEPRTIALIYKKGEPLWPEWPVIPASAPVLTDDVVRMVARGSDGDSWRQVCVPVDPKKCLPPGGTGGGIADLVTFLWGGDGSYINGADYQRVFWKTIDVPKPDCKKKATVKTTYIASAIAGDPTVERETLPEVVPGVLIETPDSLVGWPKRIDTVKARVVKGDHKGRPGEDVEFTITLLEGEAKDYGLDGTSATVTKKTDGDGYAKAELHFGEGFAKFKIEAKWKRPGECPPPKEIIATSPLYPQFLRFTSGAPTVAWDAAKKVWEGSSAPDVLKGMPEAEEGNYESEVFAVAGLLDENRDSVVGEKLFFKPAGDFKVDPEEATTELFGIARTVVQDPPEKGALTLKANPEEKYKPVSRPFVVEGTYNSAKIEKFKIGVPGDLFVIIPDDPPARGEPVNGNGKIEINAAGMLITELKDITLTISDVMLEEGDEEIPTASAGTVSWKPSGDAVKANILGFAVELDSVVIRAESGAGIGGKLGHAKLEQPVSFYAEMNTKGDFYGEVSDVPEIAVAGFTLKEGTSFAIDLHPAKSDKGMADDWQGLLIREASLQLPQIFNGREGAPSTLSVTDFYIGTADAGFGGKVALQGKFFTFGYAGYEFQADEVSLNFEKSELSGGTFAGEVALPAPMEGKLRVSIGKTGDEWKASIGTDNPVSLPRLQTVFTLRKGEIIYDEKESVGTLKLDAVISSTKFGDIDINGFEFNSKGEVKGEFNFNKAITFNNRLTVEVDQVKFVAMGGEYGLSLTGGFMIPAIGIDKLKGSIAIAPGPEISVKLDEAKLSFENGAVKFDGELAYNGNEFRGAFEIGIKKLLDKGIKGSFIVGTQAIDDKSNFTYWYVEMSLGLKGVLLGQTGLALLELGGGVGWNYAPPVGDQPGSPRNSNSLSFKAIVGIGNAPSGEVFAGRLTMVLTDEYFTLNGKLWLLKQEENMFGEGQLTLYWNDKPGMEGFVRMFVGLPDAEGGVFYFNGKINFKYRDGQKYIRSEKIEGAVLKQVKAEANLEFTEEKIEADGRLWYDLNKSFSLLVATAIVDLHLSIKTKLKYVNKDQSLTAKLKFEGTWDVNLDTPVGMLDLLAGTIAVDATLAANTSTVSFTGTARVRGSVLWFTVDESVDVGYTASI
ncbi:MAG: hypothetical protein IT211_01680 [Armatimonadetes bacterium]|nr:hypothetical protein [Armatimonadota bacterium]